MAVVREIEAKSILGKSGITDYCVDLLYRLPSFLHILLRSFHEAVLRSCRTIGSVC